ncbi:MAG: cytochrome c biogenesis protein CcsA [Acidobacteriaceae bacterium]|nr:cytochrome c biogenesis protein CcsA [Acidobacteriaceae bacterium]
MARAKTIAHPAPADGNLLLGAVGFGTAFMLIMGLLGTVKTGSLFNEANLLFCALTFYSAATVLYNGFGVTGTERFIRSAWIATWIGFISNTLAAAHRWYIAGHAPFSNVYEMLLAFIWAIAALTIFIQWRWGVKVIGTITMPLAMLGVLLMQLLPSDIHPLVPALQSTWLHIHVTLAMLSYAACAVSFGLAMMFLIQDKMRTESFLANVSALSVVIYSGILTRFAAGGGLKVVALNPETGGELYIARGVPLMVVIPDLGYLLAVVLLVVLAPLALYAYARWKMDESAYVLANRAFFVSILFQIVATLAFVLRMRGAQYPATQAEGVFPTSLTTSPFILAGFVSSLIAGMLYLMLTWRRDGLQQMLPSAESLDNLTYKTIGVAFPLLTAMIAAGAYWANRTWGSYWSWDPKETAALITWLVYAGYLHMRIARGWRGRRAAYFAVLGFAVVMFTFFGVTYLLPGLHAYA